MSTKPIELEAICVARTARFSGANYCCGAPNATETWKIRRGRKYVCVLVECACGATITAYELFRTAGYALDDALAPARELQKKAP